ncbi:MFS transporter [Planosporangium mesophilum]|uniref:MFS transporter n=1 Tax=Planosporangium mesophilum TaxID=689768 RepID=A0A8J3TFP6_9ACTN|nr:MFS transporter [Planosporangium mesophilum]NJC83755.1 MFS transporter [Planosporangium mesophilum]GII26063.1 MFS transporter [Planosporangium mesophilum]
MRLGLLRHHDFRQLFVADTISQFGTQVSILALPLIAVLVLHADPLEVGVLAACETAAFLLVGLPAGAWVDRMRRRNVLIVGDLGRAVLLGSVPVAWWLGVLTMPQLYAVALLTGVFTVFFDVAYQSYLPHLVGRENLVEGNSNLEAVRGVNQVAGPTAAGLLIGWLTAPVAVVVDAASFAGSALFVGLIRKREPKPERKPDAHLGREIAEGLRFVWGNRLLRAIAMCTGSSNLFSNIIAAVLVVLLARDLRLSPGMIGLFFSFGAVGGLIGALVATRVAARIGQGPAIWIPVAVSGPFQLLFPLAQRGWLLWAAAAGYFVYAVGVVVYNVTQVSFRQGLTPERLLGRMNATMRFLVWGTMPIGGLIGGVLGKYVGIRETLWIGAICGMFTFLPVFLSPLRSMRELPTGHDEEPALAL